MSWNFMVSLKGMCMLSGWSWMVQFCLGPLGVELLRGGSVTKGATPSSYLWLACNRRYAWNWIWELCQFKKNQISPSFIPKRPITLGHKFYLVHLLGSVATTSLVWIADRLSVLKRRWKIEVVGVVILDCVKIFFLNSWLKEEENSWSIYQAIFFSI